MVKRALHKGVKIGSALICAATLALLSFHPSSHGADAQLEMWSCAVMGQRRPVLYLAERGSRSYIKFQGQRISATHRVEGTDHHWDFGQNSVLLSEDLVAKYFQGANRTDPQGVFKCKLVD